MVKQVLLVMEAAVVVPVVLDFQEIHQLQHQLVDKQETVEQTLIVEYQLLMLVEVMVADIHYHHLHLELI